MCRRLRAFAGRSRDISLCWVLTLTTLYNIQAYRAEISPRRTKGTSSGRYDISAGG